jgi:hypothetical protein
MCHYGITGFGSAKDKAIAKALGMTDHVTKLENIVSDMHSADELSRYMGEQKLAKAAVKHASEI